MGPQLTVIIIEVSLFQSVGFDCIFIIIIIIHHYHCRYVNSVLGNKYVVILIDQSGSMTGTSSTIARLSTIELIVDMAENDFFIAYRVSGDTVNALNPYEDNSNTFLRASRENKLAIAKLISDMGIPMGKADFTDALNAGYEKLMVS